MTDKYGIEGDPYCYKGTGTLLNLLNIKDFDELERAERDISFIAASSIKFFPPPYDLGYLQTLHHQLFSELYEWAGELRRVDISKGSTRFCNVKFIEREADKLFGRLEREQWLVELNRDALVPAVAEFYGDLNVIHPFREGNGRTQRLLFEHLIINSGFEIDWEGIEHTEWIEANISAYLCDYAPLERIFDRVIGIELN
ncbi:putative adenosine monophosphate-protein transferase Fic [Halotalea alkalilenta]|uniref:protein adenylyltransferase n=1 Tax=Halotalea alkalilenta TaxID=376489 RepID=A0A172YEK6_9GAMM|nr:putative adenosine monophosphate-protein transferase Fic [Halotalea alkalilenta]ANF57688.1 cell filamentation protein Fic [Halotalea alkalilenta]